MAKNFIKRDFNSSERPKSLHRYEKSAKSMSLSESSPAKSKRSFALNPSLQLSLLGKAIIIFLCVGFIFVLFNREFDPRGFFVSLTEQNFAPFDYNTFLAKVNSSLENLPSWLSGLKGISQIVVSLGYSFFWFIGFINFLITG